jgi:hypothetical protein
MSGVIYKGKKSAWQKPDLDFIPRVGVRQRPKFEGTREQCIAIASQFFAQGARATVTQQGNSPIWRAEAQVEGIEGEQNQNIQNTHELRVNVNNPDIRTNTKLLSLFALGVTPIAWIYKESKRIEADERSRAEVVADINDASQTEVTGVQSGEETDAVSFLDELLLGADTFIQFQYVYVHTFNFGTLAELFSDYTNVGKIFTSAGVESAENIPAEHVLPAGEWIKLPPERIDSLGQNTQLKYEYWWAESWSRLRYDEAS